MSLYNDEGVVLRTQKLGEADRIITVFTRKTGVRRLVAKGVRKTTSRFGATLEPFMHIQFQAYQGRNLDTITQTQLITAYGTEITAHYDSYLASNVVVEASEKIGEGQPFIDLYLLLLGALRAFARHVIKPEILRDAFLIRAVALAGWAPEIENCVICASKNNLVAVSVPAGGSVCKDCRPGGSFTVTQETIALLNSYLRGDWKYSLAAASATYNQAGGFIAAYLQWHLERTLKSYSVTQRTLTTR